MQSPTVALCAANLARTLHGIGAWVVLRDQRMAEAKAQGARILVMTDCVSAHGPAFTPASLTQAAPLASADGKPFRVRVQNREGARMGFGKGEEVGVLFATDAAQLLCD
jgi:hypothetical protein